MIIDNLNIDYQREIDLLSDKLIINFFFFVLPFVMNEYVNFSILGLNIKIEYDIQTFFITF